MALIVQKFGGTSVATTERIKNVAKRIARWKARGNDIIVVPSAMSGETNRLIALAKEISPKPDPRELDVIAATGEQVTIGLLAMALQEEGLKAKSYTGPQVRVLTDSVFTKARILKIDDEKIRKDLDEGYVVIVAGFQGADEAGNITTNARSTPTLTVFTPLTRASFLKRANSIPSPSRKCWKWPVWARRCCKSARSNSPANTRSNYAYSQASKTNAKVL